MATLQLSTVLGTPKRFFFCFVRNTLSWPLGYNFLCLRKGVNFPFNFSFPSRQTVINPFVYYCLLFLSFYLWFNASINSLLSHLLDLGRKKIQRCLINLLCLTGSPWLSFLYHTFMSDSRKTRKPSANHLKHCYRRGIWIICDSMNGRSQEKIKFSPHNFWNNPRRSLNSSISSPLTHSKTL